MIKMKMINLCHRKTRDKCYGWKRIYNIYNNIKTKESVCVMQVKSV